MFVFAFRGYTHKTGFLKVSKSIGICAPDHLGIFINHAHSQVVLAQKLLAET